MTRIKRIYTDFNFKPLEFEKESVTEEFSATASDGKNYKTNFYSLDAIIAVGYRVNSKKATQFRIWATKTLKEFIIKGFVLDDKRLKQGGQVFGKDYFEELLERIREIRASERRFYQKTLRQFVLNQLIISRRLRRCSQIFLEASVLNTTPTKTLRNSARLCV